MVCANADSSNCKVIVNGSKCHPDDIVVDVGVSIGLMDQYERNFPISISMINNGSAVLDEGLIFNLF